MTLTGERRTPTTKVSSSCESYECLLKDTQQTAAELAGEIVADMTWLKEQNLIQLQQPSAWSTFKGRDAQPYWSITWELVLIIDGRNLRYEARWPATEHVEERGQDQRVCEEGQTCIAAAFNPGTA